MGLDYIDLMLIHWPNSDNEGTYRTLEEACRQGKLRAIGLSNFNEEQTRHILETFEIAPSVKPDRDAYELAPAAISLVLYELMAPLLAQLFIRQPQTLQYGTDFLRIRSLATPLMFVSFFVLYIFQGLNRGGIALFLGVTRWAVFNIPLLVALNACLGMMGIVWAQVSGDILTVILSLGLIEEYRQPGNLQKIYYRLTARGEEIQKEHEIIHRQWKREDEAFLDRYSPDQVRFLEQFFSEYNDYMADLIRKKE